MTLLDEAKLRGEIGSILMLFTLVPFAGPILTIIGFTLVLIAVKYISDHIGELSIFKNYLIAVILAMVAIAVGAIITFMGWGYVTMTGLTEIVTGIIAIPAAVLIVIWIIWILAAIFIRRSFNAIASALNIKMFYTAALLYFIGALLIIVFGAGYIIILVAIILQTIAFFRIPVQRPPPPPPPPSF